VSWPEGERERGVELGGVEGVVDVLQLGLGLGLQGGARWCWEGQCWERDAQESLKTRDRVDGCGGEGGPRTDLSDVPPEVLGVCIADVNVELAYEGWGWVRGRQVRHQGCGATVIEGTDGHIIQENILVER